MSHVQVAAGPDELVEAHIRPGDRLHVAVTPSRPNALIGALCRVFGSEGDFTVSLAAVHSSAHALALSGSVRRLIGCFIGETYPSPGPSGFYRDLRSGRPFEAQMWSLLSFQQRLMAAAQGMPYAVTKSLTDSDLAEGKDGDLYRIPDPNGTGDLHLVTPLRPDLTLLHGVCADRRGNIVLIPPHGEGPWSALAAKRGVIASVERIVDDTVIDAHPEAVTIPGERVLGLCQARYGAHPQGLRTADFAGITGYRDDYVFIEETARRCQNTAEGLDWYREWVLDPGSHETYLARLPAGRLAALARSRRHARRTAPPARTGRPEPPTIPERLMALGSRAIREQVRDKGYRLLFAGIGASHIAAWHAAELLRRHGIHVRVCAELGFYGMRPVEPDVFLFSQCHADSSQYLAGIHEVLGGLAGGGGRRCLGVLGAAEIDPHGNINTSFLPDGRWLTGSGGANDLASSVDCVVVAHATRRRYVTELTYRTSPGRKVAEIACQFGRFRRGPDGTFTLAAHLADGIDAVETVATATDWPGPTSPPSEEPAITDEELLLLRRLDPDGVYRLPRKPDRNETP